MSKILVTGGIGSHVVELFIARGFKVVILDNLLTGRTSNINSQSTFYQKEQAT
jgi:UDP-glucose 4-epimerase